MAFNGSGVFNRLYSWVNDAAANIKIRADRMDNEMNGFATGLSTCITKDGQTTITANLPMAGFKHTGVADGSNRTDYASFGQVQDGKLHWVAAGGTADAITATYSTPITALVDGQLCYVRAANTNATTTPTFSPNGLTARTITQRGGAALAAGDITAATEMELRYNLANTRWEWLNPTLKTIPSPIITTPRIVGVTNASSATAGDVGEYQSVTVLSGAAVSLTTTVVANITSLSLTAGDWDVYGLAVWQGTGSTSWTVVEGQINTSSAAFATFPASGAAFRHTTAALVASTPFVHPLGMLRFNVSSTTSVFLNASAAFTVSTASAYGFLGARRRR